MPGRVIAVAVVAAALAAGFLAGRWWPAAPTEPPALRSATALFGEERPLPEFTLTDHFGEAYTRRDLAGSWTLLFFGYTHCPDVCPITLATVAAGVNAAAGSGFGSGASADGAGAAGAAGAGSATGGADGGGTGAAILDGSDGLPPLRVAFVSVDPERDTPEHLRGYVTVFRDDFLGVTGPHDELQKLTRALGVVYARSPGREAGPDYLIDHSAALLLVNPDGELQAVFTPPHDPDAIVGDLAAIRAYLGA